MGGSTTEMRVLQPAFGEAMARDRERAGPGGGKLSRGGYGALLGFTVTQVANIERGRQPRPDELAALLRQAPGLAEFTVNQPDDPPRTEVDDRPSVLPPRGDVYALTEDELADYDETTEECVVTVLPAAPTFLTATAELPISFSNSELQTFKRCKRKWWLAWYRHLRLRHEDPVGALAIGTRVHRALEAFYVPDGRTPQDPRGALERVIVEDWTTYVRGMAERGLEPSPEVAKRFGDDTSLERAMVDGYVKWLEETGADQGLRVVEPEAYLEVPFPDVRGRTGVNLIGKIDVRVVREVDGARLFIDHKTAASLTEPVRTLKIDEQMLHYHTLEDLSEGEVGRTDGALYNMLRKVKRSPRAKPPFFDRVEVRHNKHELASFRKRLAGTIEDVLETRAALDAGHDPLMVVYPTPTKNCAWDCPFVPVCPMYDDGSRVEAMVEDYYSAGDPLAHYRGKMIDNDNDKEEK